MTIGMKISRALLWLYVIWFGLEIGAGIFEMRVIIPLWATAPPESVWRFNELRTAHPQFALDAGHHFWMFSTPGLGLIALVTLIAAFATRGAHRRWLITSTVVTLVVVAATLLYFVPNIIAIGASMPSANGSHLAAMVHRWVSWNWLRLILYLGAWICALRALTLSPGGT